MLDIYLAELHCAQPLTRDQEVECARRIHQGDRDALHKLVCANLRFVVGVARKYQNRGVPLCDLISEGNTGLIRAAKTFDDRKNFKFISYAVWWVRQSILTYIHKAGHMTRLPTNVGTELCSMQDCVDRMRQDLHRDPDIYELVDWLKQNLRTYRRHKWTADYVRRLLTISDPPISWEAPVCHKAGSGDTVHKFGELEAYPEDVQPPADQAAKQSSMRKLTDHYMSVLDKREHAVITMLYGLQGDGPYSMQDVSTIIGKTASRVGQIRDNAIAKMRKFAGVD